MKKNSVLSAKKLVLSKTTVQNLGVRTGVQTGLFIPYSTSPCAQMSQGWGCVR